MTKKTQAGHRTDHQPFSETREAEASAPYPPVRITETPALTGVKLPTLRDLRFHSQDRVSANGQKVSGNGFGPAFLKLGRAVYVDVPIFLHIWRSGQPKGGNRG